MEAVGGGEGLNSRYPCMGGMEETLLIQVLLELRDTRILWWSYSPRTNPSAGPWGGASPPRPNLIEIVRLRWGLSCQT